ncbi:MAG: hypothetical protein R3F65_24015 [bacterium]
MKPILLAALLALAAGCNPDEDDQPLTRDEARATLDEAELSTRAEALTSEMVTLTTDFTLGDALDAAAENLRAFVAAQVPCATVTRADRTVTVDFGDTGACRYNGRAWTGRAEVGVTRADDTVVVEHRWTDLSDGHLTVEGTATVTGDARDHSRRVVHAMRWSDGEHTATGEGDRTQTLLDGGDGIRVDGERRWTGFAGGEWTLSIEGVELRRRDPLPQAGRYVLTNPLHRTMVLRFTRTDARTITVEISGGRRSYTFDVSSIE